ncbi:hypothetical protein TOPH_02022 [Tolypocladium ophioglossoides CBS 100239]|uniref:Uncharacterized protein n=1 Tax=Tolypocladium ophioglossoides (strain CBS 100239) TaxID=1163406 RepID=A0A0L0NHP8_TOLOC|nr:hypothetical protein TOPH_02022 [Tolypocladium ophioglossoides CBS 100239]
MLVYGVHTRTFGPRPANPSGPLASPFLGKGVRRIPEPTATRGQSSAQSGRGIASVTRPPGGTRSRPAWRVRAASYDASGTCSWARLGSRAASTSWEHARRRVCLLARLKPWTAERGIGCRRRRRRAGPHCTSPSLTPLPSTYMH